MKEMFLISPRAHMVLGMFLLPFSVVSATTPLIASNTLVPIPIFARVPAAIPFFGIVTAVVARAHFLLTPLVNLFTARVRV